MRLFYVLYLLNKIEFYVSKLKNSHHLFQPSKHQHETPTKPQTLRVPKSANTEQNSVATSRSTTPPSTVPSTAPVTDDESEPFVVC